MKDKRNIFIDFLILALLVAFAVLMFLFVAPSKELKAQENENVVNLASPNLQNKEYLGGGVYRLFNADGITIDYNVYSGIFTINGTTTDIFHISLSNINTRGIVTAQIINVSGTPSTSNDSWRFADNGLLYGRIIFNDTLNYIKTLEKTENSNIYFAFANNSTYDNWQFKIQLEKGDTATNYQVPIEALIQHVQIEKDNGFDNGFGYGYDIGYVDGFEAGLNEAFNENNLMPIAEKRGKGTAGPSMEFVGFEIPINKKVKQITILNLYGYGYDLKDLDFWVAGMSQGLSIKYESSTEPIYFNSHYNDFEQIMEFSLDRDEIVESITIRLAVDTQKPNTEVETMLDHMKDNLGFYINNKILNDDAIDRFKEIIENELRIDLEIEYQDKLDNLLDFYLENIENDLINEFDKGYDKGINENVETGGFGMILASAFTAVGALLSIQLLPNISIGAIVAIPIVFGVVMFIIGRRKE